METWKPIKIWHKEAKEVRTIKDYRFNPGIHSRALDGKEVDQSAPVPSEPSGGAPAEGVENGAKFVFNGKEYKTEAAMKAAMTRAQKEA